MPTYTRGEKFFLSEITIKRKKMKNIIPKSIRAKPVNPTRIPKTIIFFNLSIGRVKAYIMVNENKIRYKPVSRP